MEHLDMIIVVLLLIILIIISFIPLIVRSLTRNKLIPGSRAAKMKAMAEKLGLNYRAEEERSYWQIVNCVARIENIIEGKYAGKNYFIYDVRNPIRRPDKYEDSNPTSYTQINSTKVSIKTSPEEIESIITKS
jgi:hypothetical protein